MTISERVTAPNGYRIERLIRFANYGQFNKFMRRRNKRLLRNRLNDWLVKVSQSVNI